jgi:hypothetical protein
MESLKQTRLNKIIASGALIALDIDGFCYDLLELAAGRCGAPELEIAKSKNLDFLHHEGDGWNE